MGFRISWLAVQGMSKDDLLDHFGLYDTGTHDEANEADLSAAELPTGWTVLWSNDPTFAKIAICAPLSRRVPVISCWVNETSMFSSVNWFAGGDLAWFVGHDGSSGPIDNLTNEGAPEEYQPLIDMHLAQQIASDAQEPGLVDYVFDIPIEIARSITGFRYDQCEFDWGEPHFTVAAAGRRKRSWSVSSLFARGR
jgi:hypothetical protein